MFCSRMKTSLVSSCSSSMILHVCMYWFHCNQTGLWRHLVCENLVVCVEGGPCVLRLDCVCRGWTVCVEVGLCVLRLDCVCRGWTVCVEVGLCV